MKTRSVLSGIAGRAVSCKKRPVEAVQQGPVRKLCLAHVAADYRYNPLPHRTVLRKIGIRLQFQHQAGGCISRLRHQMQQFSQTGHPDAVHLRLIRKPASIFGIGIQPADVEPFNLGHRQGRHTRMLTIQKSTVSPPYSRSVKFVIMGDDRNIVARE